MEPKTYIVDAEGAADLIRRMINDGAVFRAGSAGDGKVMFTAQWQPTDRENVNERPRQTEND